MQTSVNELSMDHMVGYGPLIGFIYVFNLVVGTGALTMPRAFNDTGYILSSILIVYLASIGYMTGTFMFESMSIANAIKNTKKQVVSNESDNLDDRNLMLNTSDIENEPLMINENNSNINEQRVVDEYTQFELNRLFNITHKYEMGEMSLMFFNKFGILCFYVAMILYLYGDLAIYNVAVPKTLRDVTCTTHFANTTTSEMEPCWSWLPKLSRMNVYRLYVIAFNVCIGPMVFFNLEKTRLVQMLTTLLRWLAFIIMIIFACIKINSNRSLLNTHVNDAHDHHDQEAFKFKGVPNFFGITIYAFMCHHSLPSIITLFKHKHTFKSIFLAAYVCILVFYLLLALTGQFAFGDSLKDLYTLNFEPNRQNDSKLVLVLHYFLSLFPVFTISASFPIIGITLRNNLISFYRMFKPPADTLNSNECITIKIFFPLITLVPAFLISIITHDIQFLVGIVGSYAGCFIQYVFPSLLCYFARRESIRVFRMNFIGKHKYSSPFLSRYWIYGVLLWSNISIIFVTVNHFL